MGNPDFRYMVSLPDTIYLTSPCSLHVISPILIFSIRNEFWERTQFRHWDLGEKEKNCCFSGIRGPHEARTWGRRNSNSLRQIKLVEGPIRNARPAIIKGRNEGAIGVFCLFENRIFLSCSTKPILCCLAHECL